MGYIFNSDKIVNLNTVLNNTNINKKILNYKETIDLIKVYFSSTNMIKYFGNMENLNGLQTRKLYKYMLEYYLNLFMHKMKIKTGIDVMAVENDNDPYVCFIAECMNIIRGSIKKYVRLRTSPSQPKWCKRDHLEQRNHKQHGCPTPVKEFEYCPSFDALKKRGKTCKQILKSAMRTNENYTLAADLCVFPVWKPKPINSRKHIIMSPPVKRRGTRKVKRNIPRPNLNTNLRNTTLDIQV